MKAMKRILFIAMCICLALCTMSMGVLADDTGSITIQNPTHSSATVAGKTFNIYKVFNATTDGTSTSYSWYEKDDVIPFYDFFYGENGVVEKNKVNGNVMGAVNYIMDVQKTQGNIGVSQLAEAFHNYITSNEIDFVKTVMVDADTQDKKTTSVKIDDLTYGYYLIYDNTTLATGAQATSAVRSAVMLTTVNDNVVVTLKANRPEINKTILENDGTTYGKGTSSMIGDTVCFKIETLVPSHTMYSDYRYYINDKLPTGLELIDETIKVKCQVGTAEPKTLIENTDYVLSKPGDDGADFKVDFTDKMNGDEQFDINDKLIIEYEAKVTSDLPAKQVAVNKAILTYSNDPTNDSSLGTTSSEANVYSYQMILSKFAQDTNGVLKNVRLSGAQFELYKDETLISFTTASETTADGKTFTKYIVAESGTSGATTTLTVHNQGDATITLPSGIINEGGHLGDLYIFGLSEGTYNLKEITAPDGYILPDQPFVLNIEDTIGEMGYVATLEFSGSHAGSGSIVNTNGYSDSHTLTADITNTPGAALPETGGMGTTLFTVIGLVLMCAAGVFFAMKRRAHAK